MGNVLAHALGAANFAEVQSQLAVAKGLVRVAWTDILAAKGTTP